VFASKPFNSIKTGQYKRSLIGSNVRSKTSQFFIEFAFISNKSHIKGFKNKWLLKNVIYVKIFVNNKSLVEKHLIYKKRLINKSINRRFK
jgi:hypothetical protein